MYAWRSVASDTLDLGPDPSDEGWQQRVLLALRDHRVAIGGPYASQPIRYPRDIADFGPLADALNQISVDADKSELAIKLLLAPHAVYVLRSTAPTKDRVAQRRFAAVQAFKLPSGEGVLLVARLDLLQASGQFGRIQLVGATFEHYSTAEPDELACVMVRLFLESEPAGRDRQGREAPPQPGLWLGGSVQQIAGLPDNWREQILANGAARGIRFEVIEQPQRTRPAVLGRVNVLRNGVVIAWRPYTSGIEAHHLFQRQPLIPIDEPAFEDALILAGWELDEVFPAPPQEEGPDDQQLQGADLKTVAEAVERARSECQNLLFLDDAIESAQASPYASPPRVYRTLLAIDGIAGRWAAGLLAQGLSGAFGEAGLAFASDISETARNKYRRYYERSYNGNKIVLGPHVKLGIGAPRSCLRIYFCVEPTLNAGQFIVGHVGAHLPDKASGI